MGNHSESKGSGPEEIFGELQFEELEILSDRQAEVFVGGGLGFPGLNSFQIQQIGLVFKHFTTTFFNSIYFVPPKI